MPTTPAEALPGLLRRVRAATPRLGRVRLVAIDGPAGSGKTTLADDLAVALRAAGDDVAVVHLDDLYEGWSGLEGVWERLAGWVLDPLAAGRPARYRRYDWGTAAWAEWHDVQAPDVLVVEGCGAAPRAVDDVAVLRVWVEAPRDVRLARGVARDGEALRGHWLAWLEGEARHFARERTRERADVRLSTAPSAPSGPAHSADGKESDLSLAGPDLSPAAPDLSRDALEVAPDLLGGYLRVVGPEGAVVVRLTEVEAYRGEHDPGSHAFRGRTARNATMFGPAGYLYVYFTYGMHFCANVVCGTEDVASAVLLRAGEVVEGIDLARSRRPAARRDADLARGPARLTTALGLTRDDDGVRLEGWTQAGARAGLLVPAGNRPTVAIGPRVGVAGPGGDAQAFPWRFWIPGEASVSVYRRAADRPRRRTPRARTAD